MALRKARVHPLEVRGKQSCLVASGPRTDLDDRGPVIERIVRDEERLELLEDAFPGVGQSRRLRAGFGRHLRVVGLGQLLRPGKLGVCTLEPPGRIDDGQQPLVLAAERREPFRILERPGVGKLPLDLSGSGERLREAIAEAQACLPYFCRKRSMRPAVSTSFCLPV
jgi:hypothetical protein